MPAAESWSADVLSCCQVLLVGSADFTLIGRPVLEQGMATIEATVIEKSLSHTKTTFRKKKRKNYKRINCTCFFTSNAAVVLGKLALGFRLGSVVKLNLKVAVLPINNSKELRLSQQMRCSRIELYTFVCNEMQFRGACTHFGSNVTTDLDEAVTPVPIRFSLPNTADHAEDQQRTIGEDC